MQNFNSFNTSPGNSTLKVNKLSKIKNLFIDRYSFIDDIFSIYEFGRLNIRSRILKAARLKQVIGLKSCTLIWVTLFK